MKQLITTRFSGFSDKELLEIRNALFASRVEGTYDNRRTLQSLTSETDFEDQQREFKKVNGE